jgi:hypothetical protein
MRQLTWIPEPSLLFRHGQEQPDPRDGLTLFGPLDEGRPYGIRIGAIGTAAGLDRLRRWLAAVQLPIVCDDYSTDRPPFPGFEPAFRVPIDRSPSVELIVDDDRLSRVLMQADGHHRVYGTVDVYADPLVDALKRDETGADLWYAVIPDEVYRYCRPKSIVEASKRTGRGQVLRKSYALSLLRNPSLFEDDNKDAIPYQFDVDFHNQLKARLLANRVPTQIVRESTLVPGDFLNTLGKPTRRLDAPSAVAWNLGTAAFYKAGGRPWKIAGIRAGVCYIGIVFKRALNELDQRWACCAAQMFLDSGDGLVFRGALGPWYSPDTRDFHLDRESAKSIVSNALTDYSQKNGQPPREVFLHGRTRFSDDEWAGFCDALDRTTTVTGIRIREDRDLKLYRQQEYPVLRGLAFIVDERRAFLWTKGYVPRLQSYVGREVPNPLVVDICRGSADMETVLRDIMALTKLNYNACIYADGLPVTLRFADAVGEILTAAPLGPLQPLPFKYYI